MAGERLIFSIFVLALAFFAHLECCAVGVQVAVEVVGDLQFAAVGLEAVVKAEEVEVDGAVELRGPEVDPFVDVHAFPLEFEFLLVDDLVLGLQDLPHAEALLLQRARIADPPQQLDAEEGAVGLGELVLEPEHALRLDLPPLLLVNNLKSAWN